MSAQWTNTQLLTVPLRLVREQATHDEIRRKRRKLARKEMMNPAIVGAAMVVGFLMQLAGINWETIAVAVIASASGWFGHYVSVRKERNAQKLAEQGNLHRTSEAIAKLDLEERQRIDAKQEQFIEMVRDLHTQQAQNMQSIIDNQKAIIENQKESMKLKDEEIERKKLQISDMQKQLLTTPTLSTPTPSPSL